MKHTKLRMVVLWMVVLCCSTLLWTACTEQPHRNGTRVAPEEGTKNQAPLHVERYPHGQWRLASFDTLDRTVLWVSHILIRHAESSEDNPIHRYRASGWEPNGSSPRRSKQDALDLAHRIATKARARPKSFDALAREHSEDAPTRQRGGSLGGVRASQLGPVFLDALQAMEPHQVSGVIETDHGYHILKSHPPPQPFEVAGRRLVIPYDGSLVKPTSNRSRRTRAAALELARKLRNSDEAFLSSIRAHSEHPDRIRDGDIGVWSTIAPLYNGPEIEALTGLAVGMISPPIDTPVGFALLQRTEVTERSRYAVERIEVRYNPTAPAEAAISKATARQQAASIARRLRDHPEDFGQQQREHCCEGILRWQEGREDAELEAVVKALEPNAIATEPLDTGWAYVIAKRLAPTTADEPHLLYTLPQPDGPNIAEIMRHSGSEALAQAMHSLRESLRGAVELSAREQTTLNHVFDEFIEGLRLAESAEQRLALRKHAKLQLQRELGTLTFAVVDRAIQDWTRSTVMQGATGAN